MTNGTVENFAIELNMTPAALVNLLKSAGVVEKSFTDRLSDADKTQLLDHLRSTRTSAGAVKAPKLIRRVFVEDSLKPNPKLTELRTQTQFEFDTPEDTVIS